LYSSDDKPKTGEYQPHFEDICLIT
jgi:hypothetical protein